MIQNLTVDRPSQEILKESQNEHVRTGMFSKGTRTRTGSLAAVGTWRQPGTPALGGGMVYVVCAGCRGCVLQPDMVWLNISAP